MARKGFAEPVRIFVKMQDNNISSDEPQGVEVHSVLLIPPSALEARWFLLLIASIVVPIVIVKLLATHESRWIVLTLLLCWFGASIFPEIKIDLQQKTVLSSFKFLRKLTLFSWRRQISGSCRVQIHVQAYGNSQNQIHGYIHKIACVESRKRITLRDFERASKTPDHSVAEFARKLAD